MQPPDLVKRMADTLDVPRRVSLSMVALIAIVSFSASVGGTYAVFSNRLADLDTKQTESLGRDTKQTEALGKLSLDLQPRVRSLEDDNRDQKIILTILQATTAATSGSLESSRKDLSDRLASLQNQVTGFSTKLDLLTSASNIPLPGDRKRP